MSCRLTALTVDALDPAREGAFWAGLLGREVVVGPDAILVPGDETQLGLRFVASPVPKAGRNRMHLHLTSTTLDDQRQTVTAALGLGAEHLDVGQLPQETHVVLADPEGNELCVIEPDNAYLAGTGFLGELTCVGSRAVGFFWAAALDWPIVWDRGLQTAVQSPRGGTKVAWDGPVPLKDGTGRLHFDVEVVGGDLTAEVARLVALGATRVGSADGDAVLLADPDGNEFRLTATPR